MRIQILTLVVMFGVLVGISGCGPRDSKPANPAPPPTEQPKQESPSLPPKK